MKKERAVLSREEKLNLIKAPSKYKWFCILTGGPEDVGALGGNLFMTPLMVIIAVNWVTGLVPTVPIIIAAFAVVDALYLRGWMNIALERKAEMDEREKMGEEAYRKMHEEIIWKKIAELELIEAELAAKKK